MYVVDMCRDSLLRGFSVGVTSPKALLAAACCFFLQAFGVVPLIPAGDRLQSDEAYTDAPSQSGIIRKWPSLWSGLKT